jgi:D-proline reductase (dithiol) PrdB
MERGEKRVDGFRFLPPGLRAWIRSFIPRGAFTGRIPWTPLAKPLRQATMGLVTSAGISLKIDPPFDMEREKQEPTWGDRSFREIPRHTTGNDIDVNHLHINTTYIRIKLYLAEIRHARQREAERENAKGPTDSRS